MDGVESYLEETLVRMLPLNLAPAKNDPRVFCESVSGSGWGLWGWVED